MGGPGAPDDFDQVPLTQAWLAVGDEPVARVIGGCFRHQRPGNVNPAARHSEPQGRLPDCCRDMSGVALA